MKQIVMTMMMLLAMCVSGVEVSLAEKIKAAKDGNAEAQFQLGECYAKGEGVATNAAKAVKWYRKAAEQGYSNAQYALGMHYASGNGVAKDMPQARKWCRKAARLGHKLARLKLHELTENDDGGEGDADKHIQTIEFEGVVLLASLSIFCIVALSETSSSNTSKFHEISAFVGIISSVGIFVGLFFVKGLACFEIIKAYLVALGMLLFCSALNPTFIKKMALDNMALLGPWLSLAGMVYVLTMCFPR